MHVCTHVSVCDTDRRCDKDAARGTGQPPLQCCNAK
jgi:hypothetical protein